MPPPIAPTAASLKVQRPVNVEVIRGCQLKVIWMSLGLYIGRYLYIYIYNIYLEPQITIVLNGERPCFWDVDLQKIEVIRVLGIH